MIGQSLQVSMQCNAVQVDVSSDLPLSSDSGDHGSFRDGTTEVKWLPSLGQSRNRHEDGQTQWFQLSTLPSSPRPKEDHSS